MGNSVDEWKLSVRTWIEKLFGLTNAFFRRLILQHERIHDAK